MNFSESENGTIQQKIPFLNFDLFLVECYVVQYPWDDGQRQRTVAPGQSQDQEEKQQVFSRALWLLYCDV
jgi:hypothetical protein